MHRLRVLRTAAICSSIAVLAACAGEAPQGSGDTGQTAAAADTAAGAAGSDTASGGTMVTVALLDSAGREVGTAELHPMGGSVHLEIRSTALPAGTHGIHFHQNGSCAHANGQAFGGAGDHFNPTGRQHGLENQQGPHAGDLPNLVVAANGTGRLSHHHTNATLEGGANSLRKPGGTALVVHADADDQRTDPAGNAGARIACAVIPGA